MIGRTRIPTPHGDVLLDYDPPPGPGWERFAHVAVLADGDEDSPNGRGCSPARAVADLMDRLDEREQRRDCPVTDEEITTHHDAMDAAGGGVDGLDAEKEAA